jgi:hypothetical protein
MHRDREAQNWGHEQKNRNKDESIKEYLALCWIILQGHSEVRNNV